MTSLGQLHQEWSDSNSEALVSVCRSNFELYSFTQGEWSAIQ